MATPKFKIGDRVRILNTSRGFNWGGIAKGSKGTVSNVQRESGETIVRVKTDCGTYENWGSNEDCFELLTPIHPFDKKRALNGEKVVTRDGLPVCWIRDRGAMQHPWVLEAKIQGQDPREPYFREDGTFAMTEGAKHQYDLFMADPPPKPKPKPDPEQSTGLLKIGDRVQSAVSLKTGRKVVSGAYGTISAIFPKDEDGSRTIAVQFDGEAKKRIMDVKLLFPAPGNKPAEKPAETKPDTTKQEVKKEMATTKPTTKAAALIEKNKSAAITAARIEAGSIAVNRITNIIKPKLPMMLRGYADTSVARIVVANLFSLAVQQYASDNEKAQVIADAMMEGAMLEFVKSFNIDAMLDQVLAGVDLSKLTQVVETE